MRALGVARVSTQEQAQGDRYSITHQRQRITDYCLQRNWELVDMIDYVQSGGSNYRELQHIMQRIKQDHIQVVVVNELDRLARDMVSTLLFLEELQKLSCRFAAVSDDLDLTTPDGELKMMILSVFAHYFRKQLARKVKGGMDERARQGKHHGGRPPYGFRFVGDKLEPYSEEAVIVRQIYGWYVHEGIGAREIAKRLNNQGIPTQRAQGLWASPEILRLLRKPANVGDLQHGALQFVKDRTGVTHKHHRTDALIIPDAHPGIVDRETWDAAQGIMQSRGQHSGRQADSPYLLSGLVHCGLCERSMTVIKARKGRRYSCRTYHMMGQCQPNSVPVPDVEKAVIEDWLNRMTHPRREDIQTWVEWKIRHDPHQTEALRESARLERRLVDVANMRRRAEDALLQGAFTIPQFKETQHRLDQEVSRLHNTLQTIKAELQRPATTDEIQLLQAELQTATATFQNASTLHERRELLRRYIHHIAILPGEIRIFYAPESEKTDVPSRSSFHRGQGAQPAVPPV